MSSSITELITKVGARGTKTTLSGDGYSQGDTSMTIENPVNWQSGTIFFSVYKVDPATGLEEDGTYTIWKAILNGNELSSLQLKFGNQQNYAPGGNTVVVMHISSSWANALVEGLLVAHNPDGTLKGESVRASLGITGDTPPDWTLLPVVPTVTASNGQREHVLKYTNVDYTTTLQPGTKLRIPRSVAPPTQSMKFIGTSSQFATKTGPTGFTNWTKFTLEARVNLASYPTGVAYIASRYDTTTNTGFGLNISSTGQIQLIGRSTGAAAAASITSAQSVQLGSDVHLVAVLDIAGGTGKIYIDGIEVPATYSNSGTTAVTQSGPLQIGALNSVNFISANISEVRLWSAERTAAQIRDNANITLVGNEAGLVGLWQGNGNFNDKSANANHLTPTNGAIATDAYNPFNPIEYARVTKVVKSGSDTLVTVFCPTGTGIPNEALAATSYSSVATPFGFPADKSRWAVTSIYRQANLKSATTVFSSISGRKITAPIGSWKASAKTMAYFDRGATDQLFAYALSASTTAISHDGLSTGGNITLSSGTGNMFNRMPVSVQDSVTLSTQTDFQPIMLTTATGSMGEGNSSGVATVYKFELDYL